MFWFCDECEAYLNNQDGFDKKSTRHICRKCGYENDITFNNIKGVCSDCGKLLSDPNATLCVDCRQTRRDKAKEWIIKAGKIVGIAAVAVGATYLASKISDDNEPDVDYSPNVEDDDEDDDVVYGLGEGIFPRCKTCGAEMTEFDGWAWYTCPVCEDKVRIIEGKETWYNEIFGKGKKQHSSDFELADFCRGGDLSED